MKSRLKACVERDVNTNFMAPFEERAAGDERKKRRKRELLLVT